MNRLTAKAVAHFLRLREQVGTERAICFTILEYGVDRADLLAAAADKDSPCTCTF